MATQRGTATRSVYVAYNLLREEELNMGTMHVLDRKGDTKVIWDPKNEDEVEAAEAQFDTLIDRGFLAFSVKKDGKKGKQIDEFDPKAGKIIMVPKIAGG